MSLWRDVGDLLEMYATGGLVIQTGLDCVAVETAVPDLTLYDGKTYTQKGIRTIIQFDSDYVTTLTPEILTRPEIWQCHLTQIEAKLAVLTTLRQAAQRSWLLFLLPTLAWLIADLFKLESWADVWRLLLPMAISGLIVLLRKQIVWLLYKVVWPLVLKGVVWFVGRRYKAFIAGRG